jgi:hypothetical protein
MMKKAASGLFYLLAYREHSSGLPAPLVCANKLKSSAFGSAAIACLVA